MSLFLFATTSTGPGKLADLSEGDNVYVAANVIIGSTDNFTISGANSGHTIDVFGGIINDGAASIAIGDMADTLADRINIHTGGFIQTYNSGAISVQGQDITINNDGRIWADQTAIYAGGNGGLLTVVNTGWIEGVYGINIFGDGDASIQNNGTITGFYGIFGNGSVQTVTNTGRIVGIVSLQQGDDVYNGATGHLIGSLLGGTGLDKLTTGSDNDIISGENENDTIHAGGGADQLTGGLGKDVMWGQAGADTFIYQLDMESTFAKAGRDIIKDFSHAGRDRIDLSNFDAHATPIGIQGFEFIGTQAFSGAEGELRFVKTATSTMIYGNTGGDTTPEFAIQLVGSFNLVSSDFML